MDEKDIEDLNRYILITKQRHQYELLKSATAKIHMKEENRRARLEIVILTNEKNEILQSEIINKQTIKKLTDDFQKLQDQYFITEQRNEELDIKIKEYEKKLPHLQNAPKNNSIVSQDNVLLQRIEFLERELMNEKSKQNVQNVLTEDLESNIFLKTPEFNLKNSEKINSTIKTINKDNESNISSIKNTKLKSIKHLKMKKSNKVKIKKSMDIDKYSFNNHSETLKKKDGSVSNIFQVKNNTQVYNRIKSPIIPTKVKKDGLKPESATSTFSITPFLDRTNINTKNLLFSPLESNKLETKMILTEGDKLKTKKQSISKKKRKLGAIGKTLFDETPKGLVNSVFLQNINEKYKIFKPGNTVIDLGFSPGSWSQVAVEKVGSKGRVLGLDIIPSQPPVGASSMQGNFLSKATQRAIIMYLSDPNRGRQSSISSLSSENGEKLSYIDLEKRLEQNNTKYYNNRVADVILSDMLANISGISVKDHGASMDLCDSALLFCIDALHVGGNFICKFYSGKEDRILLKKMQKVFQDVKREKPCASHSESRESYFIGLKMRASISKKDIENM
ncbi:hypothetical protein MERGE_000484 [Pneumocystis wakefieldiae]|uniref:rRNA methyltransferase 2, mitochondrial n=1 Tax=Pneumocystis wakefieldiae TaxID=38082 RepID=A0A899G3S7_9ASCO|nr:hypothetical protein MERGE_000484 [Pneumocystis wakefieldiae]